jgi:hypothetical protein
MLSSAPDEEGTPGVTVAGAEDAGALEVDGATVEPPPEQAATSKAITMAAGAMS